MKVNNGASRSANDGAAYALHHMIMAGDIRFNSFSLLSDLSWTSCTVFQLLCGLVYARLVFRLDGILFAFLAADI